MERYSSSDFWNSACKAGLALGAVSIAYTMASTLFTQEMVSNIGVFTARIISMVLWAVKFAGCIWLMKFFLTRFAISYADVTRHDVFRQGAASAFLSALIYSAFYLAYVSYINPEIFSQAIDSAMETYSSFMDSNTAAMMEQMKGNFPKISSISNLIYCSIYGTVLSSVLSRTIISDDPFEDTES